jgi:hypothetical protein
MYGDIGPLNPGEAGMEFGNGAVMAEGFNELGGVAREAFITVGASFHPPLS